MAFFASLNPRQQYIRRFLALRRASVAFDAFYEFVRIVIENRVLKPSLRDIGFRDDWQRRICREFQGVTLRARFPPQ